MIRPTKTDNCLLVSNKNALSTWSVTMTNDAMIVSWTMMRMLGGILLRKRLMKRFASVITTITAADITSEVSSFVVTANAEQIPRTCSAMGLSLKSGSTNISLLLAMVTTPSRGIW